MNNPIKEVRLRTRKQDLPWEQAGLFDLIAEEDYWYHHMHEYVEAAAKFIQAGHDDLLELRWNYAGTQQGHYLKPKTVGRTIAVHPGSTQRINLERLRTYETNGRQLYALYEAKDTDNDRFRYNETGVCLVNVIHGSGEIRWHVPTWKTMEQQDEDDRLAIAHFGLVYDE